MNKEAYIKHINQFITSERLEHFEKVLQFRTNYITLVLEDIYQSQNASAVLRSCDCFGVQNVHIIENRNEYDVNPDVALGSSNWLTMRRFSEKRNNTKDALQTLKAEGYRIVATTPHYNDVLLDDMDITKGKFALVFGTELDGISETVKENADEFVKIPMFGFTESYNISVSAALCMYHLTHKLHQSDIDWQLSEEEKNDLRLEWGKTCLKRPEVVARDYKKRMDHSK